MNNYETITAHNESLDNLKTDLQLLIDAKLDASIFNNFKKDEYGVFKGNWDSFQASIAQAKEKLKNLNYSNQDFVNQVAGLLDDLSNLTVGDWKNAEGKAVTIKEYIDGEISRLESRISDNEKALEKLLGKDGTGTDPNSIIGKINKQIKDIEDYNLASDSKLKQVIDGKLDKSDFEKEFESTFKKLSGTTFALFWESFQNIEKLTGGTWVDKDGKEVTIKEYIDAVIKMFNDYVTADAFNVLKGIIGTEAELEDAQGTIIGRLNSLESLTGGFEEGTTIKNYIDNETLKLTNTLNTITNEEGTGTLDILKSDFDTLKGKFNKVYDALQFCLNEDGETYNLKAYIDDAAQQAYDDAVAYTDTKMEKLKEQLNSILDTVFGRLDMALQRIQSIQYVPDYDDLKITTNMAYVSQSGANNVLVVDQPTKVTYQFLPAQYAGTIAREIQQNIIRWQEAGIGGWTREELKNYGAYDGIIAWFDVKPVNTRADEAEDDPQPGFQIIAVDSYDETTGEITFTVQPMNIASAQFAANGIKPYYIYNVDRSGNSMYYGAYIPDWDPGYYYTNYGDVQWAAYDVADLEAYQARTAFAAQLRLYRLQDWDFASGEWPEDKEYQDTPYGIWDYDGDGYTDYENELASPYNVLYPAVTNINIPTDPFKKEDDGSLRAFTRDEQHQYLPYNALRKEGEVAADEDPGYRVILEDAVAGYVIEGYNNGAPVSFEQATAAGYVVPEIPISDEAEFEILKNTATSDVNENNFILTPETYAEVEMNGDEPASNRKLAIGNLVVGTYTFTSPLGNFTAAGDVLITKESGEITVGTEIVWTWDEDAVVDHNLFYETGEDPSIYSRTHYEVTVDADGAADLYKKLGVVLTDFEGLSPVEATWTEADLPEEGAEPVFGEINPDFVCQHVAIADGKLYADFVNFEWDKIYKVVAKYDLPYAVITVTGTVTTYDRNREKVVLPVLDYTFNINKVDEATGFGYVEVDPVENSWYKWESEAQHAPIFKAFVDNGIINVKGNVDFAYDADQEAFNEGELEGQLRMADPSGTATGYIDFNRDEIVLKTLSTFKASVLKSELFNSGEQDPEDPYRFVGNIVTRNVTTYIGEEVEIPVRLSYRVPAYDYLHQTNYTFDDGKWYTMASPKYWANKESLGQYDVMYMNVPALSFNIIDADKRIFNFKDTVEESDPTYFYDENLFVNFYYSGPEIVDETPLEDQSQANDWYGNAITTYGGLWFNSYEEGDWYDVDEAKNFEHAVFYYRSIRDAIPMYGTLEVASGDARFEIPTSFEANNGKKYIAQQDYSNFELRAWKPFYVKDYEQTLYIDLNEHDFYYANVLEGLQFFDGRQCAPSDERGQKIEGYNYGVPVVLRPMLGFNTDPRSTDKVWGWVLGNTLANGTSAVDGEEANGFYNGITSWTAYDLRMRNFNFDARTGVPADIRRLIDVDDQNYIVRFDYNSQTEFKGTAEVDFSFDFQTPWQKFDKPFSVKVIIRGLDQQ